jgi:hypothetical protein
MKSGLAKILFFITVVGFLSSCKEEVKISRKNENRDSVITKIEFKPAEYFFFAGEANKKAAIYKFNFIKKKISLAWKSKRENVIDIAYSTDRQNVFFLTAAKIGVEENLPFVEKAKLYRINVEDLKVSFLKEIGNAIQVYTRWEDNNTFVVVSQSFDRLVANYINQNKRIFNLFGKEIINETITFDLTKEGFPLPPRSAIAFNSPSGRFEISKGKKEDLSLYLNEQGKKQKKILDNPGYDLSQITWDSKEEFVFISTVKNIPADSLQTAKEKNTSALFIYSVKDKKLVKSFIGEGRRRFFLNGNYIVFEEGSGKNSSIVVYDFLNQKVFYEIKLKGGSGLRNLPGMIE